MQALAQNVTVIPARKRVGSRKTEAQVQKIRVAAYCRVSTDSEEQETSYERQPRSYHRQGRIPKGPSRNG